MPKQNEHLVAEQIMTKDVVTLCEKASVRQILDVLKMNSQAYNGFPVLTLTGETKRCLGIITRHTLMVILSNLGRVEDCADRQNLLSYHNYGERLLTSGRRDEEQSPYDEDISSGSDPTETTTISIASNDKQKEK